MTLPQGSKTPQEIEAIGRVCHEANRAYCLFTGDEGLPSWGDLGESYKESTRVGVRNALAGNTSQQLHESWMKERAEQGWKFGRVLDRGAKIHPNLIPYDQLPETQRKKDALFLAVVNALK